MEPRELIELANQRVSIVDACNMANMDVGDYARAAMKVYCPFGEVYHHDGGMTKSMRIYPETNSAWCFAGCGYFSPVKMVAWYKDLSEEAAAESLLVQTNYVPEDYISQWDALLGETPTVDTASLAEALKVACSRICPDWDVLQFEEGVSLKLNQCLELLPKVKTKEDAVKWMEVTKHAMRAELGET